MEPVYLCSTELFEIELFCHLTEGKQKSCTYTKLNSLKLLSKLLNSPLNDLKSIDTPLKKITSQPNSDEPEIYAAEISSNRSNNSRAVSLYKVLLTSGKRVGRLVGWLVFLSGREDNPQGILQEIDI